LKQTVQEKNQMLRVGLARQPGNRNSKKKLNVKKAEESPQREKAVPETSVLGCFKGGKSMRGKEKWGKRLPFHH